MQLSAAGDATKLAIRESGWPMTPEGVKRALGQTQGWTNFLCCLKAAVQHGINLRARGRVTVRPHLAMLCE